MNTFFIIFIGLPTFRNIFNDKNWCQIGALYTIALIFFTAIIGIYYARFQGIKILKSGLLNLYQNKAPVFEIISGASVAIASLLLIIPGFFTDIIGFLLLFPFTRNIFLKMFLKKKTKILKIKKIIILLMVKL